jgi:hypothetical protein
MRRANGLGQNHIGPFLSIWLLIVQSVPVNHDYECGIAKRSKLLFLLVIIHTNASLLHGCNCNFASRIINYSYDLILGMIMTRLIVVRY